MSSHNPFAPPEAATIDTVPVVANASHKPASAWLVQVVGLLFGLYLLWGLVSMTFQGATFRGPDGVRAIYMIDLALRLLVFIDLWYAITGIGLRSRAGRVAGLVFIGFVFVVCIVGLLGAAVAAGQLHAVGTRALVGIATGLGMGLVVLALVGFWFHAFGFSARARAYFRVGGRKPSR